MAGEHIKYICRCGSTRLRKDNRGALKCLDCGRRFIPREDCSRYEIQPIITERQFIRCAWIYLANNDVPAEVFEHNFRYTGVTKYQMLTDVVAARVPQKAVDGFDEQKMCFLDETYYDREFQDAGEAGEGGFEENTSSKGASEGEVKNTRQVTVCGTTANRHTLDSAYTARSSAVTRRPRKKSRKASKTFGDEFCYGLGSDTGEDYFPLVYFDDGAVKKCLFNEAKKETSSDDPDGALGESLPESGILDMSDEELRTTIIESACGEKSEDLADDVSIVEKSTAIVTFPVYRATIRYNGRSYTVRALPFGEIPMSGGEIENEDGFISYKKRMLRENDIGTKKSSRAEKRERREKVANSEKNAEPEKNHRFYDWVENSMFFELSTLFMGISSIPLVIMVILNFAIDWEHRDPWALYDRSTLVGSSIGSVCLFGVLLLVCFITSMLCYRDNTSWRPVSREMEARGMPYRSAEEEYRYLERLSRTERAAWTDRQINEYFVRYKGDMLARLNKKMETLKFIRVNETALSGLENREIPYEEYAYEEPVSDDGATENEDEKTASEACKEESPWRHLSMWGLKLAGALLLLLSCVMTALIIAFIFVP